MHIHIPINTIWAHSYTHWTNIHTQKYPCTQWYTYIPIQTMWTFKYLTHIHSTHVHTHNVDIFIHTLNTHIHWHINTYLHTLTHSHIHWTYTHSWLYMYTLVYIYNTLNTHTRTHMVTHNMDIHSLTHWIHGYTDTLHSRHYPWKIPPNQLLYLKLIIVGTLRPRVPLPWGLFSKKCSIDTGLEQRKMNRLWSPSRRQRDHPETLFRISALRRQVKCQS